MSETIDYGWQAMVKEALLRLYRDAYEREQKLLRFPSEDLDTEIELAMLLAEKNAYLKVADFLGVPIYRSEYKIAKDSLLDRDDSL